MTDAIKMLEIRRTELSVDEVYGLIAQPRAGGLALFVGTVREHDHGKDVSALEYSAYPSADDELRAVAEEVVKSHDVLAVAAVHRIGHLEIGDIAVVVGVAAEHRGEAFAAARQLIDQLKRRVPIWKHQHFLDGSEEWVGIP